ncbi:SET domain-containing protein [Massarina eburnea CBS 473.64]|uniref:SET domain-containing protein n=1 Tax=Massarina eburnea CBS 473.64 TaxID=1395130 RepID=A0A6A6RP14_9PLEO|nr:SET domain-containing protein [Massarina eburnea CBS 473.64]
MPSKVVIPVNGNMSSRRVSVQKVDSILSNRVKGNDEQYLVRWTAPSASTNPPLSWHSIHELARCLEHVQDYLESRQKSLKTLPAHVQTSKKRKSPDSEPEFDRGTSRVVDRRLEETGRTSMSRSPSVSSTSPVGPIDVYNGVLETDSNGFVFCRSELGPEIAQIKIEHVPTPEMLRAQRSKVDHADILIRAEYSRRLHVVPGEKIHLVNIYDSATPSLRFRYIADYVLGDGVFKADLDTQEGCQKCSPHMGRDIGCEYTKRCGCLEYAAVNEAAITEPEMRSEYDKAKATGGSLVNFPKRFPYYAEGTKRQRAGTLVPFYLDSRRPIYECNDKCRCGPLCRNKNVQFGRSVQVEIFKTGSGRGWGLRCKQPLYQGQFIDTYRGEIITDTEASRREAAADSKTKASYLYSLDKFAESEGIDDADIYVVDGEFMGGPTKFMNHCCEPNCRQYTVSYNKHDPRVYDIAFFACRDIPAGEELTFDYLDKEEGEEIDDPGQDAIPCLCGAAKCRKWLWT